MTDSKGNIRSLQRDTKETDLDVLFQENLKFHKQISQSVGKASQILGLINRPFAYLDCGLFLKLYKSLV